MRSPVLAFGLMIAIAFSGYAVADPQPLTRADCTKAGMTWDDSANVCGGGATATPAKEEGKKSDQDHKKNDKGEKKGKKGGEKKGKKGQGSKKGHKGHGNHATKKSTSDDKKAAKKERKFFKWLKRQDKKS